MMPVHVEVEYFLLYQTLLFIADCWPIRIAVRILCGHMYVSLLYMILENTSLFDVH